MSKWNGKIRCVDTDGYDFYTKDKIYEVRNGIFLKDNGNVEDGHESFTEWCYCSSAKWEEVDESILPLSDLKDGMIVELNNGDLRLVCDGWLMGASSSKEIREYNDKLEYICNYKEWNIKAIYTRKVHFLNGMTNKANLTLIWERESENSKQIKELNTRLSQLKSELSEVETKLAELN